tara:strand:+ start:41736 stop:42989 length:1254 start_codon:yes stop_codon:yes gene_type:complete
MPTVSAFAADSWPQFRGPSGDGIARAAAELPTEWSAEKNIAWKTDLPGEGWSSPVVADGRIYVTAAIPIETDTAEAADQKGDKPKSIDYSLSLIVMDAQSGERIDTIHVMDQNGETTPRVHAKNSHASPTPIIDGDRIYVHFGYQGTACVTRAGQILWTNRELFFKPTHGNGGTPILVGRHLIFTCDGDKEPKVVALNADTGKLVWQTQRPVETKKTFSFCTPTAIDVDGQTQVVAPGSDNVLALDPMTGDVIWDVRYVGYSVVPKPVYHNGMVYVATSFDSSKLLAIRPTGKGVVTDSHVQWQVDKNMPKTPSLIAHDGLIYSISDDGIATCIDAESGDVVYRKRIGGKFSASPLLAGSHIYLTSEDGVTTVVKTGREFDSIAENPIGDRTLASLAVAGDALIMRTEKSIFRIEMP